MQNKKNQQISIVKKDLAHQIMRISKSMEDLYKEQLQIIGHYDAETMFKVDQRYKRLYVLNRLYYMDFSPNNSNELYSLVMVKQPVDLSTIHNFICQQIVFYSHENQTQNTILIREQAENFRNLIAEQLYIWVNAKQRVNDWLSNLTVVQAEILDHLMIKAGVFKKKILSKQYKTPINIPEEIYTLFSDLFRLDIIHGDDFLNIHQLYYSFSELSLSSNKIFPAQHFRVIQLFYPNTFKLVDYKNCADAISLLKDHAHQYPHLLSFTKYISHQHWHRTDLFAKQHFYQTNIPIWDEKLIQPLFQTKQEVNWLFKQDQSVVNWAVDSIQHTSSRITMTAMSFNDCSQFHSSIILATLQHFQYVSARIFILSCAQYAEKYFDQEEFKDLTPSVLYLDEWLVLLNKHLKTQSNLLKIIYTNLSRLMYGYMHYLRSITQDLPLELMLFILPETQQGRTFIYTLKRFGIGLEDFRQRFYLRKLHIKEFVFDSYVRDYLVYYLGEHHKINKNMSWFGFFEKAIDWHHQMQKEEMLEKLKMKYLGETWSAFCQEDDLEFNHWHFQELKNLDLIVKESQQLRHCLAASYTAQIVQGEYVAFHMYSTCYQQHLTLGCHVKNGLLSFDQLEYSNNKKAEQVLVTVAKQFIEQLNLNKQNM